MRLDFFDCNAQIGRFGAPVDESFFSPRELIDKLAPLGITRAVVFHALAKELHPADGNPALTNELDGHPLVGCWVGMPHHTGEVPHPREFVEQVKLAGARAVRLFPAMHQYSIRDWCAGELLGELAANRVPVFIEAGQAGYDDVASALASHPELRLTLVQTSYRCDRFVYPLMERYRHFRIDISNYVVSGGIEAVCRRFGAERLLFGTGSPFLDPGGPVSLLTYADISDNEKLMIASKNLEGLLAWY